MKFTIELTWRDGQESQFTVEIDGKPHQIHATLMMITRGTLMQTSAERITAYNEEGFDVISYIQ